MRGSQNQQELRLRLCRGADFGFGRWCVMRRDRGADRLMLGAGPEQVPALGHARHDGRHCDLIAGRALLNTIDNGAAQPRPEGQAGGDPFMAWNRRAGRMARTRTDQVLA